MRYVEERERRERAMAAGAPPTADYVAGVVLQELDRRTGREGRWRVEGPLARGRDSWIFRANSPLSQWPLAVKLYCDEMPAEVVTRQDNLLRRYHARMAGRPELTVPAPWAVLPEERALIMEWIDEPQMVRLLSEAGGRRDRRAELFAVAGRWLRHFHDQSGLAACPLSVEQLQWHVDRSLANDRGAGERVRDAVFRGGCRVLTEHAGEFEGVPVPHAICHGDFTTSNLFHGPRRTVGFDFGARQRAPVTYDICRFLSKTETAKPFLTRKATLAPLGTERQDLEAFMAAYGPLEAPLEGRLLSYLHLAEVLRRWAALIGSRSGTGLLLLHPVIVLRLRRMVRSAAAHVAEGARKPAASA